MRIGLLTTSFPRSRDDVAGTFVLGFARALIARGHSLNVLAPEDRVEHAALGQPGLSLEHVAYLRPRALSRTFYGAGVPDNLARDPLAWLGLAPFSLALTLAARARARRWDAVVSHWALPCALAAGHAAERAGIPHLAVFHSADLHLLHALPRRAALARRIASQAHGLWFLTNEQRDAFAALLPHGERERIATRTIVAPMGIEPPVDASALRERTRRELGLSRFCVLALSRLVSIKGLDVAVRAIAGRDVTLVIAGEGNERAALERLARERGSDVRFLGLVGSERKPQLFSAADAFVLPSRTLRSGRGEGVPTALLEAIAHGLPAVATLTGGLASILEDERTGLLVPPDDPAALALALARLQHDPALRSRLGAAGRTLASSHTWPALGPRIDAALRLG